MKRFLLILVMLVAPVTAPVMAVEPDEILDDPVLETRARSISAGLRCLQCRNESIDESNAGIARDLRILVRQRLLAGDADDEVVDYIVARYGEYVLLRPNGRGSNLILWGAGPVMLVLIIAGFVAVRRRKPQTSETPNLETLSDAEEHELQKILGN